MGCAGGAIEAGLGPKPEQSLPESAKRVVARRQHSGEGRPISPVSGGFPLARNSYRRNAVGHLCNSGRCPPRCSRNREGTSGTQDLVERNLEHHKMR